MSVPRRPASAPPADRSAVGHQDEGTAEAAQPVSFAQVAGVTGGGTEAQASSAAVSVGPRAQTAASLPDGVGSCLGMAGMTLPSPMTLGHYVSMPGSPIAPGVCLTLGYTHGMVPMPQEMQQFLGPFCYPQESFPQMTGAMGISQGAPGASGSALACLQFMVVPVQAPQPCPTQHWAFLLPGAGVLGGDAVATSAVFGVTHPGAAVAVPVHECQQYSSPKQLPLSAVQKPAEVWNGWWDLDPGEMADTAAMVEFSQPSILPDSSLQAETPPGASDPQSDGCPIATADAAARTGGSLPRPPTALSGKQLKARRAQSLEVEHNASHGTYRVWWVVDARKLKSSDRQAVSPCFEVAFVGGRDQLKMIARPSCTHGSKGGASFNTAKGRGSVEVCCLERKQECEAQEQPFCFRLGVGSRRSCADACGPVEHRFSENLIAHLPKAARQWDFGSHVDTETQTFDVCLEILGGATAVRAMCL